MALSKWIGTIILANISTRDDVLCWVFVFVVLLFFFFLLHDSMKILFIMQIYRSHFKTKCDAACHFLVGGAVTDVGADFLQRIPQHESH